MWIWLENSMLFKKNKGIMFWKLLRETIAKNVPKKTHCCVGYLYVGCSKSAISFVNVLKMHFHDLFNIVGDIHDNMCYHGHDNEHFSKSLISWTFIFHVMLKKFTSCLAKSEKNLSYLLAALLISKINCLPIRPLLRAP